MPDGWMLPAEAARLLGRSPQWVHHLIATGVLHGYRETPHRLVVQRASIQTLLEQPQRSTDSS